MQFNFISYMSSLILFNFNFKLLNFLLFCSSYVTFLMIKSAILYIVSDITTREKEGETFHERFHVTGCNEKI